MCPTPSSSPAKKAGLETISAPKIIQGVEGKLSIFLSYKEVTDREHALAIKTRLEHFAKERVKVFVAADPEDNPAGGKWRERIAARLRNSDVLILLYSDPSQNWGWSLYESGFFDGVKSNSDTPTTLIVLHGPNVERPGPLADWQAIAIDPADSAATGVKMLLKRLYVETEIEKDIFADTDVVELTIKALTAPFSVPLIPDAPPEAFIKSIRISVSATGRGALMGVQPKIPDDTELVELSGDALELFGLRPHADRSPTRWSELLELLKSRKESGGPVAQIAENQLLWADKLALTMQQVVSNYRIRAGLPMVREISGGQTYRPAMAIYHRIDNTLRFDIVFVDQPDELDAGMSDTVSPPPDPTVVTISHLLAMCRMFRWAIIQKYQHRLDNESDLDRIFDDLRVAINNLYVDSVGRGLNETSVVSAFRDAALDVIPPSWKPLTDSLQTEGTPVTERAVVTVIIRLWKADTAPLANKSVQRTEALELLSKMRRLNRVFYEICARRLQDLIAAMPE